MARTQKYEDSHDQWIPHRNVASSFFPLSPTNYHSNPLLLSLTHTCTIQETATELSGMMVDMKSCDYGVCNSMVSRISSKHGGDYLSGYSHRTEV